MKPLIPPMALFATASALPLALLATGAVFGGALAFIPLIYMALLTAFLDQFIPLVLPDDTEGREFPGADALLVLLALGHLAVFPLTVWAVIGQSGLTLPQSAALFLGAGLWFGQVANPCAHELIHRGNRWLFRLGVAVYATMLFGHHTSAHRLVHHRLAASDADPNTARVGEGYYRFVLRAWIGSFREGFRSETTRRAQRRAGLHPYLAYAAISLASLVVAGFIAGLWGILTWIGLAALAQSQLLLADYVQHYGLTRRRYADGRLESVSDRHSWNAPHWFSSAAMLNAPRHSDHHAHPARPYPSLRLPGVDEAPRLPYALPVCCTLALFPSLWRRVMHPHLQAWRRSADTG